MALLLDIESRSRCDLIKHGTYNYAQHPSTKIICVGHKLDTFPSGCVVVDADEKGRTAWGYLPKPVVEYIQNSTGLVYAFNAAFEREVWRACAPEHLQIPDDRWYCMSAQARLNGLPASLANATRAITGRSEKDFRGGNLIRLLCIPRADGSFNKDPALIEELRQYCEQDVEAMDTVRINTRNMTPAEFHDWQVNERINMLGVTIDIGLAELCVQQAGDETVEIANKLKTLTHQHVSRHTQIARAKTWVWDRLPPSQQQYMRNKEKICFDKAVREKLLADPELDPVLRQVISLIDTANMSSVAKFQKMLDLSCEGAVCGAFVYAGAASTLRFSSRGLQLHNMARDAYTAEETEAILDRMRTGKRANMKEMSKLLRPAIIPAPGNVFVVGDWSSIEARALPWLAKSPGGKDRLKVFKRGEDIYQVTADQLFGGDRQVGKVAELALGFGGADGAFNNMRRIYGLTMPADEVTDAVRRWRQANIWCGNFHKELIAAACAAVRAPGEQFRAGRVEYQFIPRLLGGTLICTLPGGTMLQYPECRFTEDEYTGQTDLTALKAAWQPKSGDKEWPRIRLWGGLLSENVTQAFCAALLRWCLSLCEEKGLDVIAHVHDEIIVETPQTRWESTMDTLRVSMESKPRWAKGLPISAEPTMMTRYGKA